VRALLRDTRQRLSELWDEVTQYNAQQGERDDVRRVTFYCGQSATSDEAPDPS